MTLSHSYNISLSLKKSSNEMSQGQVNDIKNNTLADVTVTGH